MAVLDVQIRPLQENELVLINYFLKTENDTVHAERLRRQAQDEVMYLVAWRDEMPLGHVLIVWGGASDSPSEANQPFLEDLRVQDEFRSLGVGSQLMEAAEGVIQAQGYAQVGLAIGIDNTRAIELYQRLGYVQAGYEAYVTRGHFVDEDNVDHEWDEEVVYMVKNLS